MAQITLKFTVDAPNTVAAFIRSTLQPDGGPRMREDLRVAVADALLEWLTVDAHGDDYDDLMEWDHIDSIRFAGVE